MVLEPISDCVKSLFLHKLFTVNLKSRLALEQLKTHEPTRKRNPQRPNSAFPNTIDQYVEKENPDRFIDAFADSLNLEKPKFKHYILAKTRRPSYDPPDLLKLNIYSYLNQVRSSRKLEKEYHRNLEVMWLMKKLAPEHQGRIQRIYLSLQEPEPLWCSIDSD